MVPELVHSQGNKLIEKNHITLQQAEYNMNLLAFVEPQNPTGCIVRQRELQTAAFCVNTKCNE